MSRLSTGQENAAFNTFGGSLSTVQSITSYQVAARLDSHKSSDKRIISDVRRTFCLFVTFDLLFVGLLWIIELNVDGGIIHSLKNEVVHYDFCKSYFDIFLLAVFRFLMLLLAYALCRLRHWWVIAVPLAHPAMTGNASLLFQITTSVTSAFLIAKVIISKLLMEGKAFAYLLPIISFILAWIETWFLDFKVLPQEAKDENRVFTVSDVEEQAPLILPGPLSDGQFYSPPESVVVGTWTKFCFKETMGIFEIELQDSPDN
ncbi:STARD3 N-terminal-like protein isoform X2 [Narcine bancroftii]|uniref:STARD3 N-terminal-like protein isoform X2 n=1 Tax=Narcine bancroftii TaxID=1343680 RepID=UPI003831F2A8